MIRWNVLAAAGAVVAGAAFVTGASIPPRPLVGPPTTAEAIKTIPSIGQKTGYFNMARVMREYRRAKTSVDRLNTRRVQASKNLLGLRAMFIDVQGQIARETSKAPPEKNENLIFRLGGDVRVLGRRIEDLDREIGKLLSNQASTIIGELYDEMHAAVAVLARERGLVAVLAYPDAATPEEQENPMLKEMKLKPPAAHPFYLDPSVDYTDELIERLNAKFTAETGGN